MTHPSVGPSWLRASLTVDLFAAHVKNMYDECLFTLLSSDDTSEGQLLLDVDDFIEGCKEAHRKVFERVSAEYRYGKAVDLMSAGQEELQPIEVPKRYLSHTKEISEGMLTKVKGVNGGLGWFGSNGEARHGSTPLDHSIWVRSEIASTDIGGQRGSETMSCSSHNELRWTTFTDSGFDTGERQRHQQGWLVCSTNKYFNQDRTAPVSVLHWRSRKLTRKAESRIWWKHMRQAQPWWR